MLEDLLERRADCGPARGTLEHLLVGALRSDHEYLRAVASESLRRASSAEAAEALSEARSRDEDVEDVCDLAV